MAKKPIGAGLTFGEGTMVTVTTADGEVQECTLEEMKTRLNDVVLERCDMLQRRVARLEKTVDKLDQRTISLIRFG